MAETWCPFAERLPITTGEYSDRLMETISIVEHISAGTDSRNHLQNVKNGSSTHFLIRVEIRNGKPRAVVYQFMPIEWCAWGNGRYSLNNPYAPPWVRELIAKQEAAHTEAEKWRYNINHATISIEHEGVVPTPELYTGLMLEADLRLNKWIADTVPTIIRDREHIIGHYQIDNVQRPFCPGGVGGRFYPFDKILQVLNPMNDHYFPETGVSVKSDFYAYWQAHGGLEIFGYPIRAETTMQLADGSHIRVQSFERWRMEAHPDGIKGGLVEAERLDCAGL